MQRESSKKIILSVNIDEDVIAVRKRVRTVAKETGFSMLDQTRIVTATSELARNIIIYAGKGSITLERLAPPHPGIRLVFSDKGPGIADTEQAMQAGFSTGKSLGLGLSGSRKLVDEFTLESSPGEGTTVTVVKRVSR